MYERNDKKIRYNNNVIALTTNQEEEEEKIDFFCFFSVLFYFVRINAHFFVVSLH